MNPAFSVKLSKKKGRVLSPNPNDCVRWQAYLRIVIITFAIVKIVARIDVANEISTAYSW